MGGRLSRSLEEKQREFAAAARLLDLKQRKNERDVQAAMQMALARDRVLWMCAFYVTMMTVAGVRVWKLRALSPLPLELIPPVLVPFMAGYQADYAFGTKANRVAAEAARIRAHEPHLWFNQPLLLPRHMQAPYRRLQDSINEQRAALGVPPEPDWARFE